MTREEKIGYIKMKRVTFASIYNNDQLSNLTDEKLDSMSDGEIDLLYNEVVMTNAMYNTAFGA